MNNKKRKGFESVFIGEIVQVLQKHLPGGHIHEIARRSPGVRMIVVTPEEKILISRERRDYLVKEWDYRLPGGKVIDTCTEYIAALNSNNDELPEETTKQAVIKESKEEIGILVRDCKLLHISSSGGTIDCDLYYYEVTDFEWDEQELQHDEEIEVLQLDVSDVLGLIFRKEISEDKTRAVLLDYLLTKFPHKVGKHINDFCHQYDTL